MPLQLLEITVRPDWRELTRQIAAQRLRTWRAVQIGVAGAALIVLLTRLAFPAWSWHWLLYLALFATLFWMLPLWTVMRRQQALQVALDRGFQFALLVLIAVALVYLTRPGSMADQNGNTAATWLPLLALVVPFLTWPIVRWMRRAHPVQCGHWGLVPDRWAINLLLGALAGCALGLHLSLVVPLLPDLPQPARPLLPLLIWVFCSQAGLMALGQELLLRGLAFDALFAGQQSIPLGAAAQLILLNLLVYLASLAAGPALELLTTAWLLGYAVALAVLDTVLRYRQRSLLPGVAAGVVFSLFLAVLMGT